MKKILIVEDSALMIAVISNFVKNEKIAKIEILSAKNGEEAVQQYRRYQPNLVFMDIKMPIMDGMQALEAIRRLDDKAKVIMCTSLKEPAEEERAKQLGAVAYIMKPFSRQDILDAIKEQL